MAVVLSTDHPRVFEVWSGRWVHRVYYVGRDHQFAGHLGWTEDADVSFSDVEPAHPLDVECRCERGASKLVEWAPVHDEAELARREGRKLIFRAPLG